MLLLLFQRSQLMRHAIARVTRRLHSSCQLLAAGRLARAKADEWRLNFLISFERVTGVWFWLESLEIKIYG